ncbi:unnamed protein product [Onchocerca ochengi]|uniref:PAZ domain-containing protein n=1 Tax=Onchocerca ochengi TaxID=42157 RepID=A0A182EFX4_ONCOC|nr:unnamed protein product [Onchocerca ochengi]
MSCAAEKIKLPRLEEPPEPSKTSLAGYTAQSKRFLSKINKYNSCFQMTSFGAEIVKMEFMPTLKVKRQIYHKAGSLLPLPDGQHKFLQIAFIQTAIDMMPSDTHKIVIHADKTPAGEHVRRCNAPTMDEVAIIRVGDQFEPRDIVLHRRNDQLIKAAETHQCYDALQNPISFLNSADGYHLNIKIKKEGGIPEGYIRIGFGAEIYSYPTISRRAPALLGRFCTRVFYEQYCAATPAIIDSNLQNNQQQGQKIFSSTNKHSNVMAVFGVLPERSERNTVLHIDEIAQYQVGRPFAKTLPHSEVPTWNASRKSFERRKRGEQVDGEPGIFKQFTMGRLYTVHPNQEECFFLRMLLVNVPRPTSFQQLKIVNGVTHATFRSARQALNLLEYMTLATCYIQIKFVHCLQSY